MRKIIILLLITPLVLSFSGIDDGRRELHHFIGYKENKPVFYEVNSGSLFRRVGDKLEIIGSYNSTRFPIFISNDFTVFRINNEEGVTVELQKKHQINKKYFIGKNLYCFSGNDSGFYYTDYQTMNVIFLTFNEVFETNYSGCVEGYSLNCLYISKEHDPNLIGANADIFKYDTKSEEKPIKVANNLSGEMTYVLPGGHYVYDQILYDGEYRPSITDLNTGKFAILNIEGEYGNCYYSFQHEALIFYNTSPLEDKVVNIPIEFTLTKK